jgi:hypothetical protein
VEIQTRGLQTSDQSPRTLLSRSLPRKRGRASVEPLSSGFTGFLRTSGRILKHPVSHQIHAKYPFYCIKRIEALAFLQLPSCFYFDESESAGAVVICGLLCV